MGLKADVDEVRAAWSKSPWWGKIWLCVSGYLALSSIASLADTIVKWKGFFLDGVCFYRAWIKLPFKALLSHFQIHLTDVAIDKLIILSLCLLSFYRALDCTMPWPSHIKGIRRIVRYLILYLIILPLLLIAAIYYINIYSETRLTMYVLDILVLLFCPVILVRQRRRHFLLLYYIQIVFCFGVIAFLAALNKGIYS